MMPDVSGHVNGGPTAMSAQDLERVLDASEMFLQVVQAGNQRCAIEVVRALDARGELSRLLIASDTPTGTGTMPLGVLKSVVELSSLAPLDPAIAFAAATANVGVAYRLNAGVIDVGRPADVMVIDAPLGSAMPDALTAIASGDIPAVACVFTAGELRFTVSRNTPPPTRPVRVLSAVSSNP
jgi:enamidase